MSGTRGTEMVDLRPEDERMCETSERCERLFADGEILPINLEIGRRLLEIFGNQAISNITFRLKSTSQEINDILDGRSLPSCELLLGIKKMTGVSIDWLLTGEGSKYVTEPRELITNQQNSKLERPATAQPPVPYRLLLKGSPPAGPAR
mgnify:FL=1